MLLDWTAVGRDNKPTNAWHRSIEITDVTNLESGALETRIVPFLLTVDQDIVATWRPGLIDHTFRR